MRRLGFLLVFLVVLLVVVDRAGAALAGRAVAADTQRTENLATRPDVTIGGFPFLTQALRGRYDDVHVTVRDLTASTAVTIDKADVRLTGVHLPLPDALHRRVSRVPVDTAAVSATAGYAALNAAVAPLLPSSLRATFSFSSVSSAAVALTYTGPGGPLTATGVVVVTLNGNSIHLELAANSLSSSGNPLVAAVGSLITSALRLNLTLPRLPFGARITGVSASPSGVTVTAHVTDLILGQGGLS